MKRKFKKLALMTTLAAAALAGQAQAAAPAACTGAATNVFLAGASAPRAILTDLVNDLFNAGFDTVSGATSAADYTAFCGTLKPGVLSAGGGESVALIYRSAGGSGFGVFPLAQGKRIRTMDLSDPACTATTCPLVGDDTLGTGRIPDFGISDVEPALFVPTQNIEPFFVPNTPSQLASLKVVGTNQVIFGVGITNTVVLPSIQRSQYSAIVSGNYVDWSQIIPGSTLGPIHVCRRAPGSGTQATSNALFLGYPKVSQRPFGATDSGSYVETATTVTYDAVAAAAAGVPLYIENPSTSDVRKCLTTAQAGTEYTFTTLTGKAATVLWRASPADPPNPAGAVGFLSLENRGGSTGEPGSWTFRKIDGLDPTDQTQSQSGAYQILVEQSCQRKAALAGTVAAFADAFCKSAQKETILRNAAAAVRASVLALPTVSGNCAPPTPLNPATCITARGTRNANTFQPINLLY
jgi:ABC-type phosphate transport system substrate-binding protein